MTGSGNTQSSRWTPRLLPRARWAKLALLLLMTFALGRSVLWASVQPGWVAPDEDYHSLYVNYLVEKDTVPNLKGPFTSPEFTATARLVHQAEYLAGPVTQYSGSPHAVLGQLGGLSREPAPPRPRQVLEAPLYYIGGAIVDRLAWGSVSVTRFALLRYYSAVLGMLTIYLAWLLAAQILVGEWQQLAAAAIASLQAILAFSASTVTNDVGVAVTLTATLAWCAWMLRGPPRSRQGIGLGVLASIALITKTSLLALVVIVPFALLALWRTYPQARRELLGVLRWAVGITIVGAGWWYVYLLIKTHSILGETGNITSTSHTHGQGLSGLPHVGLNWIATVYRNYWFTFLYYEIRAAGFWFWVPLIGIVIVVAGLALYLIRGRGLTFAPVDHGRRAVLLILWTALVLFAPPFLLDCWRGIHGLYAETAQGRFLTPDYPGLAVIAVLAMGELTRYRRRAFPIATGALVIAAFCLYWETWIRHVLERFYGNADGHWLGLLHRASYYKPTWVTETSLAIMLAVTVAAFVAAFAVAAYGSRRGGAERAGSSAPASAVRRAVPEA